MTDRIADPARLPAVAPPGATHRRTVWMMFGALACFAMNDALLKFTSQALPISQVLAVRGVLATLILLGVGALRGPRLRRDALTDGRVWLRGAFDASATFSFVAAISRMDLADAYAINMSTPIMVTLFAALVHRRRVGGARWAAVLAGFAGVLLVVQPAGRGFNGWSLLMLLSAALTACRDLMTPAVRRDIPALQVTLAGIVLVAAAALAWGCVTPWRALGAWQLTLLALVAVCQCSAYLLMTTAFREGDLARLAPLRYTSLVFAAVLGYAIWGNVPNVLAFAGIALIVLAGLRLMRR